MWRDPGRGCNKSESQLAILADNEDEGAPPGGSADGDSETDDDEYDGVVITRLREREPAGAGAPGPMEGHPAFDGA